MRPSNLSCAPMNACLFWRIVDVMRINLRCQTLRMETGCSLPNCIRLCDGCLCGTPYLSSIRLTPAKFSGCCLNAQLCLPLLIHLETPSGIVAQSGEVYLPVECILRSPCCTPLNFFVQAEVCIRGACVENGALCVTLDITAVIYAAVLTPGTMPANCCESVCVPQCAPVCLPPLYPQSRC